MRFPVIAAIDPRRVDTAPALLGALLARLLDAPLVLAASFPVEPSVDRLYAEYSRTLRLETERALRPVEDVVKALPGPAVEVSSRALRDEGSPPARAIQELADDVQARMLVIGSSARGPLGRAFPGAVTDRLIHGAPCPVAVAPSGYTPPAEGLRRIAAAYLPRPDGEAALALAADLAQRAGATVRVQTVAEPLDPLLAGTLDELALEETERERVRLAEQRGLDAARRLAPGRSDGCEILHGPIVDALASATAGTDLLVCGSRGRGPVRSLLLGSTAHALVRRVSLPLVVVAPSATAPARHGWAAGRDTRAMAGAR